MQTRILIFLILLVGFVNSDAQTNFVRVTDTVLTAESFNGAGAAWADYDGDGWLDLAQANYHGANLLFHNNGDGTFTKITSGGVSVAGPESYGVSWGDYDNDGHPDLFFGNGYDSGIPNFLFHNQTVTNANFLRLTTGPGAANLRGHSSGCAWADYDRDGFLDLFVANSVANSDSKSELWHNKGDGTFERMLTGAIVNNIANSVGAAWGDYDNDGWPDLFVANGFNEGGKNFLYHNNRNGTFTQITTGSIVSEVHGYTGAAWGDYDNDGFLDLFVTDSDGHNYLYHNNGDGTFTSATKGDIVNDTGVFVSAGWADYDNDGWLDLFVGNRATGGTNLLYHNNGDGTFTRVTSGPIVEESVLNGGCAWGDYDNDGFPDLFVSVLGENSLLYRNTETTNHWLRLKLESTVSNRSAIGAKVRVTANTGTSRMTQLREITTGDGFNGNSQTAQFGLGGATNAATVRVEWPSGIVQTLTDVAAGQLLAIVEHQENAAGPISLTGSERLAGGAFRLSATGNPGLWYRFEASTDLANWTWLGARSNLTGTVEFVDSASTNFNGRFYRASIP